MPPRPSGWDALLAAARAGSTHDRGQLLETHRAYLLTVAAGELDHDLQAKADATDLVQESLCEALSGFDAFAGSEPEHLRAWLREILRNNIANVRRHYKGTAMRRVDRERPLPVPWPGGLPGEGLANDDSTPSGKAARHEEHERLHQALAKLPSHYRDVIVWRLQEHRSFADIGERLGRSASAAKQLWLRAVQRLASELRC
jgi:RNA polymerase sigma-70 factor (ECF subfamily)